MKQKINLFIFFLFACAIPAAQAQLSLDIFKKHTRIQLAPTNTSYKLEGEDVALDEGFFKETERWIVFSDRAENTTYKMPGSEIQLKSLSLMQACYVIGQDGEYLELVKYDPKLVQKRRGIIDKKSADYLGWVNKKRLLLWRTPLKENNTKYYIKVITCIKSQELVSTLSDFSIKDSLLLYGSPALSGAVSKCSMENLFYIFKQSDDGKEYLIGRSTQVTPDNPQAAVSGWISKDLIKVWGTRSFFTLNTKTVGDSISFYSDSSSLNMDEKSPFYVSNIHDTSSVFFENIYPIQQDFDQSDSTLILKTGALVDVLDKSKDEVLSVLGNKLHYKDYQHIVNSQKKINIVFVVDGGNENGKYMYNVLSTLQNLELFFDSSYIFKDFKYGAVVYKDNMGGDCKTAPLSLTSDYQQFIQFFYKCQENINKCNDGLITQAVFPAIKQATKLLEDAKDETNIIVVIGAAGNKASSYNEVVSSLSNVHAKLLVFQTHSAANPSYNDFVIQGENLVLKSAANISESKKAKLVDLNDVLNTPSFSLAGGDSGVYYLDFPTKAMTQGYVFFPQKGEVMQPSFLENGLGVLMQKIYADNNHIEQSLSRYFNTIGIRNTRILPAYQSYYPKYGDKYLPLSFLKSFSFSGQPFYLPGWVQYQRNIIDSNNAIHFGVLLSTEEYEQLIQALSDLAGGSENYNNKDRRVIYRHIRDVLDRYLSAKQIVVDERVNNLSFAETLEWLTGYKSADALWNQKELWMIKHSHKMKKEDILLFLNKCKEKYVWLNENINNNAIRFSNNGQVYYWLTEKELP
ncbi:MAG TPA: type VI secretion system protein TssR domain-containing protein [Ferruginibacter sp.]|nr:type VI secretion system protein TssR domain-containing protein [Ferruginibacter sp.]